MPFFALRIGTVQAAPVFPNREYRAPEKEQHNQGVHGSHFTGAQLSLAPWRVGSGPRGAFGIKGLIELGKKTTIVQTCRRRHRANGRQALYSIV